MTGRESWLDTLTFKSRPRMSLIEFAYAARVTLFRLYQAAQQKGEPRLAYYFGIRARAAGKER